MWDEDTIAAISTPPGTGGIGIIRISGNNAFSIAGRIFSGKKSLKDMKSHTVNYGKIVDPLTGETLDEVLLTKMEKPNTFTREDVVEINCHGGLLVQRQILELVIREGARLAEPGEFTKRAFLNGRLDLSQAEAVIDLINARTSLGSKAAMRQLEGELSQRIKEARQRLIGLIAHIEASVDFPEYDVEEITGRMAVEEVDSVRDMLERTLRGFERGRIIREGLTAAIVGRPNVGKSSLLNRMAGKNRAIVTEIPGTTRDVIDEYVNVNGVAVRLLDTAGIRNTYDLVEKIGVEKTIEEIEKADLVIMVIDTWEGLLNEDREIIRQLEGKKAVYVLNKIDISQEERVSAIERELKGKYTIRASMKEDIGIEELEKAIWELFLKGEVDADSEFLVTNIRHKVLIEKALESLQESKKSFEMGMPIDCMVIDIRGAAESLGQITGESVSEDVINEIFSRFCLGK